MVSVDSKPKKPKTSLKSEKLRNIKAKLDPEYFDLQLYKIDNEMIVDEMNDVNYIL